MHPYCWTSRSQSGVLLNAPLARQRVFQWGPHSEEAASEPGAWLSVSQVGAPGGRAAERLCVKERVLAFCPVIDEHKQQKCTISQEAKRPKSRFGQGWFPPEAR